jgi:hypothetical protein
MLRESLLLAVPGGFAGITLALAAIALLNAWKPLVLDRYPPIVMDLRTLAFTVALTLITGLVFGIVPAVGVSGMKIQETLRSSCSGYGGSRGAASFRRLLVVVELGVSLVLLIAAGLLARSFLNLSHVELGFPSANLLTLRVNLTGPEYATAKSQSDTTRRLWNVSANAHGGKGRHFRPISADRRPVVPKHRLPGGRPGAAADGATAASNMTKASSISFTPWEFAAQRTPDRRPGKANGRCGGKRGLRSKDFPRRRPAGQAHRTRPQ